MESDNSARQNENVDKRLFFVVTVLALAIFILLCVNLWLQWSNYNKGIESVVSESFVEHSVLISYSRAMDFAFVKSVTIFLGFILVLVGALYLLRVSETAYQIGMSGGSVNISLQTASPGLVLITLGVITILATTYNKSIISIDAPSVYNEKTQDVDIDDVISKLNFEAGSSELSAKSIAYIGTICNYLRANNISSYAVEVFDDNSVSPEENAALKDRRASALSSLLNKRCSFQLQASAISYGESKSQRINNKEDKRSVAIHLNR